MFALVTGASSGIGLAMSREFALRGYPLILVSNEGERLEQVAEEIHAKYNVKTVAFCMDLALPDSAEKLFAFCTENFLKVEILVNNASIFFFKDIVDTPVSRMETMINLHVLTPSLLCRLFAEEMIHEKRGGYIMNIASISARMMMPGITLYSSSKSFLRGFSRAMRLETFDSGVNITTICPGAIATDLYSLASDYMRLGIRLGVIMKPERFARLAVNKMFRRTAEYIPGAFINRLFIFLVESTPEFVIRIIRRRLAK